MGAGGRDFHAFNTRFKNEADYEVVAFTATQIPGIDNKTFPASLSGDLYPKGIPIFPEDRLLDLIRDESIDAVVFAGTPEWMVYKLLPLYEKLAAYQGPIIFLGVGFHEGFEQIGSYAAVHDIYKRIFKKADVFAVRDSNLLEFVKPEIKATLLPCPALLCAEQHSLRQKVKKIGFSLQAPQNAARVNFVPDDIYNYSLDLLKALSNHYEVEVVCHWIEDLICLQRDLGDQFNLRYSYDACDYLDIYDNYDLVISTRVHGSAMAASLGIPTFTISHSARTDTVKGFLSTIISPANPIADVVQAVGSMAPDQASNRLIAHKLDTIMSYRRLLQPYFPL